MGAMTNQAHKRVAGIAAVVPATHKADAVPGEAQMRHADSFEEPPGSPKPRKRVRLCFCMRPDSRPIDVDLAGYLQVGLAKQPGSAPRNLKTGAYPIQLMGECFHSFPLLSLSVVWLTWKAP